MTSLAEKLALEFSSEVLVGAEYKDDLYDWASIREDTKHMTHGDFEILISNIRYIMDNQIILTVKEK